MPVRKLVAANAGKAKAAAADKKSAAAKGRKPGSDARLRGEALLMLHDIELRAQEGARRARIVLEKLS